MSTDQPKTTSPMPGERLIAALLWCTVSVYGLAIAAGLTGFFVLRKRRRVLARHGLSVALFGLALFVIWSLILMRFNVLLPDAEMNWLLKTVFFHLLHSPAQLLHTLVARPDKFIYDQVAVTPTSLLFLKCLTGMFLSSALISLVGILVAVFGSRGRRSVSAPTHTAERQESQKETAKAV